MKQTRLVFAIPFLACVVAVGQSAPAPPSAPIVSVLPGAGWIVPGAGGSAPQKPPHAFSDPVMQARFFRVCAYLRFSSPLQGGDQTLAGEGDGAAFFIYTLMVNRSPLSAAETLTALDIIHKSFGDPLAIQNGQDRKPVKSLALLKLFQSTAIDQTVKERIAAETNFLNAVPQNIVAPPMGVPGPPPAHGTTPFF